MQKLSADTMRGTEDRWIPRRLADKDVTMNEARAVFTALREHAMTRAFLERDDALVGKDESELTDRERIRLEQYERGRPIRDRIRAEQPSWFGAKRVNKSVAERHARRHPPVLPIVAATGQGREVARALIDAACARRNRKMTRTLEALADDVGDLLERNREQVMRVYRRAP